MKMSMMTMVGALMPAMLLVAGPAAKVDPVAEGYPDWQGVVEKNYVNGRHICASDLRHKILVVLDVDVNDSLQSNFIKTGELSYLDGLYGLGSGGENFETLVMPRNVMFVINLYGYKEIDPIKAALKIPKEADETTSRLLVGMRAPSMYTGLTFTGAPDTTGKRPYVYVMGPTGKEPVYQGAWGATSLKEVRAAISKQKKKMSDDGFTWVPFYGSVTEPKHFPILAKTLEKAKAGKPVSMAAVEKELQKGILAKDPEKAAEAQILYDALNQTRSDLVLRIMMEYRLCPHRAVYDLQQLLKFWPGEKKKLDVVTAKIKSSPDANKLAQMFCKVMVWADPNFTCKNSGEAKKIVGELNKMKKDLEKLANPPEEKLKKDPMAITVQNGALLMDSQVDELIALIPTKVPEK